ncbi:hypothetical protein BMR85_012165 [Achromobacter sp. KAs 3-5]|nr:hypothetical protein BMR85_012165 [Achromobacter sp. KAs 3-5]
MLREGRLIAVSPCFNDAVGGCAGLLAARPDSTVLTVYSGQPLPAGCANGKDSADRLASGRDAILARQASSERALSLLGDAAVRVSAQKRIRSGGRRAGGAGWHFAIPSRTLLAPVLAA